MKQWGLAVHNYASAFNMLPPGRICFNPGSAILTGQQDTAWFVLLLPYIEEGALGDQFNYERGSVGNVDFQPPYLLYGINGNFTVCTRNVKTFLCPSDSAKPYHVPMAYAPLGPILNPIPYTRSNYAASWGNTNWGQNVQNLPTGTTYMKSAFGHQRVRLDDFTDGLSQTVVMSETIQGTDFDLRGFAWTPLPGGGMFMTRYTPNGTTDLYVGTGGASGPGDGMPNAPGLFCNNEPPALPCYSTGNDRRSFAGARSRHPGGVLAARGDGSASFVSDSIDRFVWYAAGTIAGAETNVSF
jgi:hypothetical protein